MHVRVKKQFYRKAYIWYANQAMNNHSKSFFWALNQFQMNLKRRDTAYNQFYRDIWNKSLDFDTEYMYSTAKSMAHNALDIIERLEREDV